MPRRRRKVKAQSVGNEVCLCERRSGLVIKRVRELKLRSRLRITSSIAEVAFWLNNWKSFKREN